MIDCSIETFTAKIPINYCEFSYEVHQNLTNMEKPNIHQIYPIVGPQVVSWCLNVSNTIQLYIYIYIFIHIVY
jgi:hypothetical protein